MILSPLLTPTSYPSSSILNTEHHHKPTRMKRRFPQKGGFCWWNKSTQNTSLKACFRKQGGLPAFCTISSFPCGPGAFNPLSCLHRVNYYTKTIIQEYYSSPVTHSLAMVVTIKHISWKASYKTAGHGDHDSLQMTKQFQTCSFSSVWLLSKPWCQWQEFNYAETVHREALLWF